MSLDSCFRQNTSAANLDVCDGGTEEWDRLVSLVGMEVELGLGTSV